jgi:hypothetical protein
LFTAVDDPRKVVKVVASDGKTGETRDIAYTNCKVIGNGSFGVVFQAKLTGGPQEGTDIAIKKVLQDKRFKVHICLVSPSYPPFLTPRRFLPLPPLILMRRIVSSKS